MHWRRSVHPKLSYTLRSSPSSGHAALEKFGDLLRKYACTIANTDLTDIQWIQDSLPVRNGGLGVRRELSLVPAALVASAAGTLDLQELTLAKCDAVVDSAVDLIMVQRTLTYSQPAVSHASGPLAAKQHE